MTNLTTRTFTVGQALLVLVAFVFFGTSAFAQPAPVPGAPILVVSAAQLTSGQPPATPTPQPSCCAASSAQPANGPCCLGPLDKRAAQDVAEYMGAGAEFAKLPHGGNAPNSSAMGFGDPTFWFWVLGALLLVGVLIWALTRNRQNLQPPVVPPAPVVPPVPPAPAPVVPPPPAPLPAGAPAKGHCVTCGTSFGAGARFCLACGRVLPLLILAAILLVGGHFKNLGAQTLPAGDYRQVQCPAGVPVAQPICLQPINAAAVVLYIPPTTGTAPSGIVPTAPPPPAPAPVIHHHVVVRSQERMTPSEVGQVIHETVKALREEGLMPPKGATLPTVPPSPAPPAAAPTVPTPNTSTVPGSPAIKEIVNRLTVVEQKQERLAGEHNKFASRFQRDEANAERVEGYLNLVAKLTAKNTTEAIPHMSNRGGQQSPACQAYLEGMQLRGGLKGNPPKGCELQ